MTLHWLIAFGIMGVIVLGSIMADLTPGTALKFELYQLHKSIGITILTLTLVRLAWRLANPVPPLPLTMARWERGVARFTHIIFYVMMLAIPLSGWMMVSASVWNLPTVLYGVVELPHLPVLSTLENKKPVEDALKEIHETLAWWTVGLLILHVAGALKHHFVARDDTLRRMLPWTLVPAAKREAAE
jgi:cytochrome b561